MVDVVSLVFIEFLHLPPAWKADFEARKFSRRFLSVAVVYASSLFPPRRQLLPNNSFRSSKIFAAPLWKGVATQVAPEKAVEEPHEKSKQPKPKMPKVID